MVLRLPILSDGYDDILRCNDMPQLQQRLPLLTRCVAAHIVFLNALFDPPAIDFTPSGSEAVRRLQAFTYGPPIFLPHMIERVMLLISLA